MSRTEDFVKSEKAQYEKIFSDISFTINDISDFLDKPTLNNRKYVTRISVLSKYIELLDSANLESKKSGFLGNLLGNNKYIDLVQSYKNDHISDFTQLESCSKCACLNCTSECKFDSCNGCSSGKTVAYCDHKRTNVVLWKNKVLNLTNNATGSDDRYSVLALVQDALEDKRYILIENLMNSERFILYYTPGISEDSYGEITDEKDFNFAASAYENLER
ncbi:DUF1292 domain-containing protein [Clostridium felsineum]|uniref:DUF1292 domain-containing protein n=1 Tax=Clostridium felsineum TaxID=36839 RepID=UPI00098C5BB6|nr:DUF1292 domain-containing protein [Clostridium felsineum]URZ18198.1 hypothetical protein CLFE_042530 [Clostridium felsineum DSM 794]